MNEDGAAFLKRLLATFKGEAEELLRALEAGLIGLEQTTDAARREELVEAVFREVHSLKGAARAVDRREMERVCQAGEEVLAGVKGGHIALSAPLLDLLHAAVDALDGLLASVERVPSAAERSAVAELCRRLGSAAAGASPASATTAGPVGKDAPDASPASTRESTTRPEQARSDAVARATPGPAVPPGPPGEPPSGAPPETTPQPDAPPPLPAPPGAVHDIAPPPAEERHPGLDPASTVRIQTAQLDAVLRQAEALLAAKLAARTRVADLSGVGAAFAVRQRERVKLMPEVRLMQRRLERAVAGPAARAAGFGTAQMRRLLNYLADEDAFAKSFQARLAALLKTTEHGVRVLGTQVDGLHEDLKRALMLPVSSVLEGLPRLVRDLAREQGKEVGFHADGGELEIDRRVLEEVRDPLIHLVRNSLDHGIETPDARVARGKPVRASLTVSATPLEGSRIEIRVADDGAGIDLARLRACAQRLGIPVPADEDRLLALAFESGVTTSPLITDISGRGLGLAIVRDKVERLGGSVTVSARAGLGTTFRLVLPLTLATFRGVRVRAAGEEFIFPSMGLERVVRVRREDIGTMENRETIRLGGEAIALARLGDVLGLAASAEPPPAVAPAVVSGTGERRIAFLVDEVVGEQEVLVKSLGRQLRRVRNIAGATVLGSGQVVPILYLPDLMKSARRTAGATARAPVRTPAEQRKTILLAEDSITSRVLLKGILESAGYAVVTAVDGIDAYTRLHTEPFDLLVSDVEMPRMDGFDLTARVRADRRLADLPVVLVTALDSRQDRERGADAGANAYLVKSSFDQNNLLATVRRLL
jgi:two-component system chemotaxis sensor kinase CheA